MAETHPSTARLEHGTHGAYVPCPKNQPFAYQSTESHDNGQLTHISKISGYCEHLVLGGCHKD